ncbi:hypothetical protein BH20BAC1_BH20BAC1_25910 [soil metagenome]
MLKVAGLVMSVFIFSITNAQNNPQGKLKVYIDCRVNCDFSFFKSEITIVDFVLDRVSADAYVLLTGQRVGGGGMQYEMNFYGQHKYNNYTDTLFFDVMPNSTQSETRETIYVPTLTIVKSVSTFQNRLFHQDKNNLRGDTNILPSFY